MAYHNQKLATDIAQAEANRAGFPRYVVREDRTAHNRGILFIIESYPAPGEIVATVEPAASCSDRQGGVVMAHKLADAACLICEGSGYLILDAVQVEPAMRRYQWATLSPGANDCVCVQAVSCAKASA